MSSEVEAPATELNDETLDGVSAAGKTTKGETKWTIEQGSAWTIEQGSAWTIEQGSAVKGDIRQASRILSSGNSTVVKGK